MSRLNYPRNRFEIIIVDDGSLVPITVSGYHLQKDGMITLLRQLNAGPASARAIFWPLPMMTADSAVAKGVSPVIYRCSERACWWADRQWPGQ